MPTHRDASSNTTTTTTPSLPPVMDSVRSHTADEIVQMMKRTPLFMTNLQETPTGDDEAAEENIQLEALRALQYEGTRAEVALGFKERGNEMVAEKRWKDAKEFYTKGIVALKQTPKQSEEPVTSEDAERVREGEEEEREKEKKIEEACYVNRALCNLELKNYRSTLTDTSHTLHLFPQNTKAHYRSSLALSALTRYPEALDTITRGLALTSLPNTTTNNTSSSSSNPPHQQQQNIFPSSAKHQAFRTLYSRISALKTAHDRKEAQRFTRAAQQKKEHEDLNAALAVRGIKVRMTAKAPEMEDARIF
ncbi:MAG: hypothetical protein Q9224_007292, partial [Gallowayella concinna]